MVKRRKGILKIPHSQLTFGKKTGVTLKEAKRAFLSGMSKSFRRKIRVKFTRR